MKSPTRSASSNSPLQSFTSLMERISPEKQQASFPDRRDVSLKCQ